MTESSLRMISAEVHVAEIREDGKVVGRARLAELRDEDGGPPYGYIHGVFVDEHYRGQGLGTRLTRFLLLKSIDLGHYKCVLTSRAGRLEVHAWYEAFGFRKDGFSFRIDLGRGTPHGGPDGGK